MNSPISDLITRVKNAYLARLETTTVPYSQFRESVLSVLKNRGYLTSYSTEGDGAQKVIVCELKYTQGIPAFTDAKIFSKPGRRWYIASNEIKSVKNGYGTAFISTNKGVMSGSEAKKLKLGGELLFEIW